jgi:hypothetical protein
MTFRTPDEAIEQRQQHDLRARRRRLDREGLAHLEMASRLRAGVVWAQHLQPLRARAQSLRRIRRVGLRPRGRDRQALAAYLQEGMR